LSSTTTDARLSRGVGLTIEPWSRLVMTAPNVAVMVSTASSPISLGAPRMHKIKQNSSQSAAVHQARTLRLFLVEELCRIPRRVRARCSA
jgi:hypothetical protein